MHTNMAYKTYDELPLSLTADDIAAVLNISRAGAYSLMHAKDFPTLMIGKRMVSPRDKFIAWIEKNTAKQPSKR